VAFKGRLTHYLKDVVEKVDAIESGKAIEKKKSGWF